MEYKYEIVSEHPLDIPESLRLDDGFADVIGRSLKVGLEMGYAENILEPNSLFGGGGESDQSANCMDQWETVNIDLLAVKDFHIIKVAYPKLVEEPEVEGGTTIVLNEDYARAFRKSIDFGMKLTPAAFKNIAGHKDRWTSARMKLMSTLDINHHTADLMSKYYSAVENADWGAFRDCISDHIQYVGGSWFSNEGDLYDINTGSHGYARGIGARQLIATTQHWREQYRHVRYDLDMTSCMMNQTTAIVYFKVLKSENGVDWDNALPISQCTSIYQIDQGEIISLQHVIGVDQIDTDMALNATL